MHACFMCLKANSIRLNFRLYTLTLIIEFIAIRSVVGAALQSCAVHKKKKTTADYPIIW